MVTLVALLCVLPAWERIFRSGTLFTYPPDEFHGSRVHPNAPANGLLLTNADLLHGALLAAHPSHSVATCKPVGIMEFQLGWLVGCAQLKTYWPHGLAAGGGGC